MDYKNKIYINKKRLLKQINTRTFGLFFLISLMFLFLITRAFYLQVIQHEKFTKTAELNITQTNKISPERGIIKDKNNVVIANNRPIFSLVVIPEKINGYTHDKKIAINDFLNSLFEIIKLENLQKEKIKEKLMNSLPFEEVLIKNDINTEELSSIASNIKYLDELSIQAKKVRNYPFGENYLNTLGYVAKISTKQLKNLDKKFIKSDYIGRTGLESIYNYQLYGEPGYENIAVNSRGKIIKREKVLSPKNGKNLKITIDNEIQSLSKKLLEGYNGSVVAVDPNNGNIISLMSTPTYDANKFIKGISQKEYSANFKKNSPLFNRAIQGQYNPASIIKPFLALAALENKTINPTEKVWSGPYYQPKGTSIKFRDWKRYGHGWIDLEESIEVSSDVYYYKLAEELGIDNISLYLSKFNFGKKWGIGLYGENSATLPSRDWKMKKLGEKWYNGETINIGIGQGHITTTPLQLAMSTSVLANGGKLYKPNLIADKEPTLINTIDINTQNLQYVREGLRKVMIGEKGTARKASELSDFTMAGKTGTAQVISTNGKEIKDNEDLPMELRDHALFIGYAPYENPKIAIAVVIEHGSSGSETAAPIAVKIMDKYLKNMNIKEKNE